MTNPLADINNICFVDVETRTLPKYRGAEGNLKHAGTYRYVRNAFVIVSTWAVGSNPVREFSFKCDDKFDRYLDWDDVPAEVREFHKRVEQREAWYAAFNAGFDRNAIMEGIDGAPEMEPDMFIDVMAQAIASNLPPNLEGSSRAIGRRGKQDDGKQLINLFCSWDGAQPFEKPYEWSRFVDYGVIDTEELREVYKATRALPFEEWRQYWASEAINSRGVGVDVDFVTKAAALADAEATRLGSQLSAWTGGTITAVTQRERIATWLYDAIPYAEAREMLVKEWDEDKEAGDDVTGDLKVGKLSVAKNQLASLSAFYEELIKDGTATEHDLTVYNVIVARQFGGSSSPFKFGKMALQQTDERIRGQYVFNGAAQTGRFSSKGIQTHNLTRATLGDVEDECIEFILDLEV